MKMAGNNDGVTFQETIKYCNLSKMWEMIKNNRNIGF